MFSDYATAVDTRQERTLSMMDDERDNFISETLIPENLEQLLELDLIRYGKLWCTSPCIMQRPPPDLRSLQG